MQRLLAVMLVFLASLFAEPPNADPVKAACGADADKFNVEPMKSPKATPTPEPGKALVYVVNANRYDGTVIRIGVDGTWAGANRKNTYLFFQVTPGEHHLCANRQPGLLGGGEMRALAPLQAEPGRTYYFRTRFVTNEQYDVFLDFDPINSDQGRMMIAEAAQSDFARR